MFFYNRHGECNKNRALCSETLKKMPVKKSENLRECPRKNNIGVSKAKEQDKKGAHENHFFPVKKLKKCQKGFSHPLFFLYKKRLWVGGGGTFKILDHTTERKNIVIVLESSKVSKSN